MNEVVREVYPVAGSLGTAMAVSLLFAIGIACIAILLADYFTDRSH